MFQLFTRLLFRYIMHYQHDDGIFNQYYVVGERGKGLIFLALSRILSVVVYFTFSMKIVSPASELK